jgi:protein phosphatase
MEPLFVTCTDPGSVRQQNEDFAGNAGNDAFGGKIFCVADGMGGHGYGELASRTAVESLLQGFQGLAVWETKYSDKTLTDLFSTAQKAVQVVKVQNGIASTMGTTLAALIILSDAVICANVGDTRIYCLEGRHLIRKSHDHTLVDDLLSANQITPEQARTHPQKNILTHAITGDPTPVVPHIQVDPLNTDHIYLICSDGLYNMVDEEFITAVLTSSSVFQARDYLLKQAYANGAKDNITFQIIKPYDDEKTVP